MSELPRVPPGYRNVTIYGTKTKAYASGYDAKGRRQIIYNKWFIEKQRKHRFRKVLELEPVFESIIKDVDQSISKARIQGHIATKALQIALVIKIMVLCNFRVGSMKYLKQYKTHGVTTLMWKHITFKNSTVTIRFVGKKNVINESVCTEPTLYKLLKNMSVNHNAQDFVFSVSARDVNDFIKKYHPKATAKDIRTWRANILFIKYYNEEASDISSSKKAKNAVEKVATFLHNTPAVCKSSYIHPSILDILKK